MLSRDGSNLIQGLPLIVDFRSYSSQMACWTVVFAKILADHRAQYIAQRGDAKARSQILRDCRDQILKTPQANHLMLPDSICAVSN